MRYYATGDWDGCGSQRTGVNPSCYYADDYAGNTAGEESRAYRIWLDGERISVPATAFGIEAEFFGCYAEDAVEALRRVGLEAEDDGYHHQTRNYWRVTTDSSVAGEGLELVSPPLPFNMESRETVDKALAAVRRSGGIVNRTCGLHVHHNAARYTIQELFSLAQTYALFQPVINSLVPASRRNGYSYCKPVEWNAVEEIERQALRRRPAYTEMGVGHDLEHHLKRGINGDRFVALNFQSLDIHNTVEFRQHNGTLNTDKVWNWLELTRLMMRAAKRKNARFLLALHGNSFDALELEDLFTYVNAPNRLKEYYRARVKELQAAEGIGNSDDPESVGDVEHYSDDTRCGDPGCYECYGDDDYEPEYDY